MKANVDARSSHLVQFAKMGSIYMEHVVGVKRPRVGIVNIGAEEEKGNALVKETFPLLKQCDDIHFTGSIEAREIPAGACDVVVCEAFVGDVILKLLRRCRQCHDQEDQGRPDDRPSERSLVHCSSEPALKETLKSFDASEYGGAPLLGLKGLVVESARQCKGH